MTPFHFSRFYCFHLLLGTNETWKELKMKSMPVFAIFNIKNILPIITFELVVMKYDKHVISMEIYQNFSVFNS